MNPLVSIIIPAYNKADLTIKTIESVLAQTYKDIEIIVVDDGSVDDTKEKLSHYRGIKYVYKENGGACSARNLGIKLARGEYLGFLDCDDLYVDNKVELSIDYFKKHPDVGLIHTAASFIDDKDVVVGQYSHPRSKKVGWIARQLILGNNMCNSTIIAKKKCFDEVGGFDESMFMPADWDMWLRISEKFPVGYIDRPLSHYRVTDNYILKRLDQCREEEVTVINKFFKRNELNPYTKKRIFSFLNLRYAQNYLLQNNFEKSREELVQCLRNNPFNGKAYLFLIFQLLAQKWLIKMLNKRILRYNT